MSQTVLEMLNAELEMLDAEFKAYNMKNNENPDICKKCKHPCCTSMGCEIFPVDLIKKYGEVSLEVIEKLFATGYVSLDWWEGDPRPDKSELPRGYFLRMRNVGAPIVDPSYRGQCMLYDPDKGCKLSFENRPLGGRLLVPHPDGECNYDGFENSIMVLEYPKQNIALHWFHYYDILEEAYNKYNIIGGNDEGGFELVLDLLFDDFGFTLQ